MYERAGFASHWQHLTSEATFQNGVSKAIPLNMQSMGKDALSESAHIADIGCEPIEEPRYAHGLVEPAHLYQGKSMCLSRRDEPRKLTLF